MQDQDTVAPRRRGPDLTHPLLAGKLTIRAAADAFGVSMRTMTRLRGQGLPVEGRGALLLLDIEKTREWLAARGRGGNAGSRRRARNAA